MNNWIIRFNQTRIPLTHILVSYGIVSQCSVVANELQGLREEQTIRQHPYYVDDLSRGGSDVNSSNLFQNGEQRKSLEKSLDTVLHSLTVTMTMVMLWRCNGNSIILLLLCSAQCSLFK